MIKIAFKQETSYFYTIFFCNIVAFTDNILNECNVRKLFYPKL